ncbi:pyridoxamine 5'-phosphate oxidase family protein [Kineococcus endophyticus]|uniref:Pyridoxamine 5'-phosphate oxidase family protein n=1 Tax=Kineococcus endophyticus TaxID=1181883 RepID=A0ABV3P698_9ACTN
MDDTVAARLTTERTLWCCTLRPDGSPHQTPVWFVHLAGAFWIGTAAHSVKVRNVRADPRVSLALPDGDAPVVAEGDAAVRTSGYPDEVVAAFDAKYGWDVRDPLGDGTGGALLEVGVRRWLMAGTAH